MIAAIRVRGTVNIKPDLVKTMEYLRLQRPNHMVLIRDENKKMVEKAKDYITFGEISEEVLAKVLEKRGRIEGDKRIDAEFFKGKDEKNFEELAKAIINGKKRLKELGIKPVFRMHPPKKGYERVGVKKPFGIGGALGYRGEKINNLIIKMN